MQTATSAHAFLQSLLAETLRDVPAVREKQPVKVIDQAVESSVPVRSKLSMLANALGKIVLPEKPKAQEIDYRSMEPVSNSKVLREPEEQVFPRPRRGFD